MNTENRAVWVFTKDPDKEMAYLVSRATRLYLFEAESPNKYSICLDMDGSTYTLYIEILDADPAIKAIQMANIRIAYYWLVDEVASGTQTLIRISEAPGIN